MMIIGEKINGTRKQVGVAIRERDAGLIKQLALEQVEAGAHYLDVNAGTEVDREAADLVWLVQTVQQTVAVPVCLDSPNAATLKRALEAVDRQPLINSLNGEPERLTQVLPLVVQYQCPVIVLALDDNGIPKTVDELLNIIERLVTATRAAGIADEKLYIDPLIMAISTGDDAAMIACETMRCVHQRYPEAHLTGGLSNVSYGSPMRKYINLAFLVLALEAGMDSAIMDPTAPGLTQLLLAAEAVLGRDRFCHQYNRAYRAGKLGG